MLTTAIVSLGLALCARFAGEPFSATSVLTFTIAFFSVGAMPQRRTSLVALVVALVLSLFAVHPLTVNRAREEEQQRRRAAEHAVAAERLRLAQDLHDVVSHNVGMIAVQAGAADVLLEKDPAGSRESQQAIENGARETLLELRRLLGLLREDDPEPLTRRTTLTELPCLTEPLGRAGVEVSLQASGEPVPLTRDVEVAAYRLVQEALTNVVAHAGRCRVEVTLRYSPDSLGVDVVDDGTARAGSSRGGYGLTGIRERVAALGGTSPRGRRAAVVSPCALFPLAAR